MADSNPVADDAGENQDHPDQNHEMGKVFAQRKSVDGLLANVRDDVVHDEIEEKPEYRHDEPETGEHRKGRPRRRRPA